MLVLRALDEPKLLVWNKLKQTVRQLLRTSSDSGGCDEPAFAAGTRFRAAAEVAAEALGEELVLVHLGRGSTFRLNRTGKRVWELVQAGRTAGEIVGQLQVTWPVSAERLEADVGRVLAELVREQLLEPIAESAA